MDVSSTDRLPDEFNATLVLASASPRRRELLEQLGLSPVCRAVDIDETPLPEESPAAMVLRLAELSESTGLSVESSLPLIFIGADTTIEFAGQSLGKPDNREHCIDMLRTLSEREHRVHTGVAVSSSNGLKVESRIVTTHVQMGTIPADKAGAYGIQGIGARYVEHISGSYSNVVGLPLYETLLMLQRMCKPPN